MTIEPWVLCLAGTVVVVVAILVMRLHAFLALLLASALVMGLTPLVPEGYGADAIGEPSELGGRLGAAFGRGAGQVGILIALAAVIGQCLLRSGGAGRIVEAILGLFGVKRAPLAFLTSGFVLGVPVFFDTVFYLLLPLVRAFARRAPQLYLLALLSVVAGATMAHSLVPPTPGPLFVASELGVDLGVLIPAGLALGVVTTLSGFLYAAWLNRSYPLPLREDAPELGEGEGSGARVPALWASLVPIVVPVALIVGRSAAGEGWGVVGAVLLVLGEKNLALGMGAALGLVLLAWARWGERGAVGSAVREALASGGVIILITAAGSAFGSAMGASGVAGQLAGWMPGGGGGLVVLWVAFGVTALVRMAQGSATVAMITAVGIVGPLVGEVELGYHAVYLALAIGCGSKPGPWMNDSGFWVVSRMSGMTEVETLRSFTVQLTLMGVVGFLLVLAGAWLMPLV